MSETEWGEESVSSMGTLILASICFVFQAWDRWAGPVLSRGEHTWECSCNAPRGSLQEEVGWGGDHGLASHHKPLRLCPQLRLNEALAD